MKTKRLKTMKKHLISIASVLALSINLAFADNLVFDPAIKTGTLDNGLKYYILKNEQTKNNAYFYLNSYESSKSTDFARIDADPLLVASSTTFLISSS